MAGEKKVTSHDKNKIQIWITIIKSVDCLSFFNES